MCTAGLLQDPRLAVALAEPEPRINFVLNCGTFSSPYYVWVFDPERVHEQLDLASEQFLRAEVAVNVSSKTCAVGARARPLNETQVGWLTGVAAVRRRGACGAGSPCPGSASGMPLTWAAPSSRSAVGTQSRHAAQPPFRLT